MREIKFRAWNNKTKQESPFLLNIWFYSFTFFMVLLKVFIKQLINSSFVLCKYLASLPQPPVTSHQVITEGLNGPGAVVISGSTGVNISGLIKARGE